MTTTATREPFRQTIDWLPGGAQGNRPEMYCDDSYLVAVRVCSGDKSSEWWEFSLVTVSEDGFRCDGGGWGWSWDDVQWYVDVKNLSPMVLS